MTAAVTPLSIYRVIRPAIYADIRPPWERGEVTNISLPFVG